MSMEGLLKVYTLLMILIFVLKHLFWYDQLSKQANNASQIKNIYNIKERLFCQWLLQGGKQIIIKKQLARA